MSSNKIKKYGYGILTLSVIALSVNSVMADNETKDTYTNTTATQYNQSNDFNNKSNEMKIKYMAQPSNSN
jgi:hypothetical protein